PDATIGCGYNENPGASVLLRERAWQLMEDPSGPGPLWLPMFRAVAIGWTLPMQARRWLDSRWYSEIERPLDSCWGLDAMIGEAGRSIAFLWLTRPRSARPFTADDVQLLDRLRPGSRARFAASPGMWRKNRSLRERLELRCSAAK